MTTITVELLRERYRYDPETGNLYSKRSSGPGVSEPLRSSFSKDGYLFLEMRGKRIASHRAAWAIYYGEMPSGPLDHIDRDRRNNRIENLRLATSSQNACNYGGFGAIPAKGVFRNPRAPTFVASIAFMKKRHRLGDFDTVDEAAHAYNKAAIQLHGEFAVLNPVGVDKQGEEN